MTISPWLIYLWGIADSAKIFFIILAVATLLLRLFRICCSADEKRNLTPSYDEACKFMDREWSVFRSSLKLPILFAILALLSPSSKTIAMMVVIPAIVNSQPIQKDLPEIYDLAIKSLKDQLTVKEVSK